MIESLIISLILTLIIEIIVALILGVKKSEFLVIICANVCTNPIIVYIVNCFKLYTSKLIYNSITNILEIFVIIAEYNIYKKYLLNSKEKAFKLALLSNIISYCIGLAITNVL